MNRFARSSNMVAVRVQIAFLMVMIAGWILTLVGAAGAQLAVQDLISIPRRGTQLMKIDRDTGETISSLTINLPAGSDCDFRGGTGLALNPLTQELFALLNCGSNATRLLATIGLFSGNATIIGDTGNFFAGLAFSSDGTLFAVTGNGAIVMPNTLFTISTVDATATPVCQLPSQPSGAGGQAIAFDPDNGLLFQASGAEGGGIRIFESIDDVTPTDPLDPCPATLHGPTGDAYNEAGAMVFGGSFFLADLGDQVHGNLYRITNDGVVVRIGEMDHVAKGLAFISGPTEVCYKVKKDDAAGSNESVDVVDSIVGPRTVVLKLKKAFTICVPGAIRFTTFASLTPPGAESAQAESDSIVTGKVCYRVKKDDSGAERKTDLQVDDEGNGSRTVRIKTSKAFVVCDQALIDTSALP